MKKNSVLIIDDTASNIEMLMHILGHEYTLYAAKNGANALIAAEHYVPDLILLDIIMPDMNGYEVIKRLGESEKTRDIPVIFITGLDSSDDEMKGLSLGAVDYISKPFNDTIVKLRVENQLKLVNETRLKIAAELAVKSSRAKSEFLSRMSHEMRTPMNAIIGMTKLALGEAETEKQAGMLAKIDNASSDLVRLIDNILDMTDIEDNKFRLADSDFSFPKMMEGIFQAARRKADEKRQTLTFDIDHHIPEVILGDERRYAQVIMSLLSNAIKFTQENGTITLRAFVKETEGETIALQIEVADDGIGMTEEAREKLFVPFEQADGGIARKFGGAGLGLAISKYIVELMGGEIWVESVPDEGSKFSFTIKVKVKAPELTNDEPVRLNDKVALLVEDVEINREIIMAALEDTGITFVCAENGLEALALFSADPAKYDVVLMDINMPVMDGLEAAKRIRAHESPEGAVIPIIAVTANILASEVETYLAAGMNDHIGKPIDFGLLLRKIGRSVRG